MSEHNEQKNMKLMPIRMAARAFFIPEHALRRWVKEHKVDARYSGRKALVCVDSLEEFISKGGDHHE